MNKFGIAIHGGAGTILKSQMSDEKERSYKDALQEAVDVGYQILIKGGPAIDAVEASVRSLEDCPLFNAGRGAVFNAKGGHELDASIMDGKTLDAGAIAAATNVKNPITLAKAVMHHSDHVLLIGDGAKEFAIKQHIDLVEDDYFHDDYRFEQWQAVKDSDRFHLDHANEKKKYFGTVGAVALDLDGNLAAATSTGGMTNKKFGRVGDSPIIGAGNYANNQTCAVSCTGSGEFFMRAVTAYDISCRMLYQGQSLKEASEAAILEELTRLGGDGGVIAIDGKGNICMPFNCEGMYRAFRNQEDAQVLIYQ